MTSSGASPSPSMPGRATSRGRRSRPARPVARREVEPVMMRLRFRRRLRAAMLLGVGAALTGVVLVLALTDPLRQLELDTVDTRFSVRGSQTPPRDLVLVKIDD